MHLVDKQGIVQPPLHTSSEAEKLNTSPASFQNLTVVTTTTADGKDESLAILDASTGRTVAEYHPLQRIYVEMGADASRTHGPRLRLRLLSDEHPAVRALISQLGGSTTEASSSISNQSSGSQEQVSSAMQRVLRQRAAKPYRPPEMFASSSAGIDTQKQEVKAMKGPPPGFAKEVLQLDKAFSSLAVAPPPPPPPPPNKELLAATTRTSSGTACIAGETTIPTENSSSVSGKGITVDVPMDGYLESIHGDESLRIMGAAVKLMYSKANRYSAKAGELDPRSKQAGRWAAKAAACRIEGSRLREYLRVELSAKMMVD